MNPLNNLAEPLGIGRPEHNDSIQRVTILEIADIFPDDLHILLFAESLENVISSLFLIASNKVFVVDRRHRHILLHVRVKLFLEVPVEDLSAFHGLAQVHLRDVPAANDDIGWLHQRHHLVEFGVDFGVLGAGDLHG
jgi:hypothetical protein